MLDMVLNTSMISLQEPGKRQKVPMLVDNYPAHLGIKNLKPTNLKFKCSNTQARRNKKILRGLPIMKFCLPPWLLRKKIFISDCLIGLKKLNIYRRQAMQITIIKRCLLRNYLELVVKLPKFLKSLKVWSLVLKSKMFLIHLSPVSDFCTPENVRKPKVFWHFQGV